MVEWLRLHASNSGVAGVWGTKILHAVQPREKKKKKSFSIMDPRSSQLTFTVFWRDYKFSDNKNTLLRMYYMLNTIISNLNIVTKRVDLQTMLQSRDYHPNFVGEKAGVSDNYFPKFMKLREDPNLGGQN